MRGQGRQRGWGYFLAVAATAALVLLHRFVLADKSSGTISYSIFLFAVLAAAWLDGLKAGLLATALGAGAGTYFFTAREGWRISAPEDQVQIAFFLISGAAVSWFTEYVRRSRDRAEEQRESLRITLSSVGDAVITTDVEGQVTALNPVAATLTGWVPDKAVGRPLDEVFRIVNEHTRQPVHSPIKKVLAEGRITGLANHTLLIALDGTERPIDDSAAPIRDAEGIIRGVVLIFRDITELKKLHQQLQQADRRKDEFLATLAHELRNPLAAIRNALQVMRIAGDNRNALEQALPVMERQVQQMVRLIDDLMDVSRIARHKLQLRTERVDLAQVVRHAGDSARPLIEATGHALTIALPAEPISVDADEARLAQVFANLLDNAAKYTERGGRISLTLQREGGEAVVRVKDTGIGIAPDQLAHIFEMFAQVDSSLERSRGGLGIGLTLVKRLTEMHGGTIEAFSEGRGRGSEFVVRLPIVTEPPAQQQPAPTEGERQPGAEPCKVLIVDDSEDASISMRTLLHIMGHDTRTAHDGLEAVALAEAYRPDVVLLDISLPKLNGYEVARHIRQQPWGKAVKLVALTGWAQEEDKRRSIEAGFDHHIIKPVEPVELEELLRKLCSGLA